MGREGQGGGPGPRHLHLKEGFAAQRLRSKAREREVHHRQEMVGLPMDQIIAGVQMEGTGALRMILRRGVPFKKMIAVTALAQGTGEALSMMMKVMVLQGAANSLRLTKYF